MAMISQVGQVYIGAGHFTQIINTPKVDNETADDEWTLTRHFRNIVISSMVADGSPLVTGRHTYSKGCWQVKHYLCHFLQPNRSFQSYSIECQEFKYLAVSLQPRVTESV